MSELVEIIDGHIYHIKQIYVDSNGLESPVSDRLAQAHLLVRPVRQQEGSRCHLVQFNYDKIAGSPPTSYTVDGIYLRGTQPNSIRIAKDQIDPRQFSTRHRLSPTTDQESTEFIARNSRK